MEKPATKLKESFHQKQVRLQKVVENKLKAEADELGVQYTRQTLTLITNSLGIVAGLAWNEVIREVVEAYIKPFFGEQSGLISLLIYATIVTALVVFISYNLSKLKPDDKKVKQ